jgi:hypothetical protein
MSIQVYVVLDKKKLCTGSVRSLNMAVVRPTTVQLTNCSFGIVTSVKALPVAQTGIDRKPLCIIYKCYLVLCSYRGCTEWPGRHDSADTLALKLRCNKRSAYIRRQNLPSSKRRPHFETHTSLGEIKNLCHGSREDWRPKWLCWRRPAAI